MAAHENKTLRECLDLPAATGRALTEAQVRARSRNFALMQVMAMQTNVRQYVRRHLEIWQTEPLQEALRNAENHLRKEIQNGKAKK